MTTVFPASWARARTEVALSNPHPQLRHHLITIDAHSDTNRLSSLASCYGLVRDIGCCPALVHHVK